MATGQLILVLVLATLCSAFKYTPAFFPGPPPRVPTSASFDENELLDTWIVTHYTNPSFDGYHCMSNNITKTTDGIQFGGKFLNASGAAETFTSQLLRTTTPGVYVTFYNSPQNESLVVTGTQAFVLHGNGNSMLTWALVAEPESNRHTECVLILSKTEITPPHIANSLQLFYKTHGGLADTFRTAPNHNCQQ